MAASLESKAAFMARAASMGMEAAELTNLKGAGITTFALLAFSCNYIR